MNRPSLLPWTALLAAAALALPSLLDARPAPVQEPVEEEVKDEAHEALEASMKGLKNGMRALRRGLADPAASEANLKTIREMQDHALAAVPYCPEPFTEVDAAGAVAWEVGYKRAQLKLADDLMLLELAVAEGRLDDAQKMYGALNDLKKKGHDTYDPSE